MTIFDHVNNMRSFFSYKTGVSLLLPNSWEEVDDPNYAAFYADRSETKYVPSIAIKLWQILEYSPDNYRRLAIASTEISDLNYKESTIHDLLVDNYPAVLHSYSWFDEQVSLGAVQQQVFIQIEDIIFCITCTVVEQLAPKYLPVFEKAIQSIRFIPINS